jgi:hypothetical protein
MRAAGSIAALAMVGVMACSDEQASRNRFAPTTVGASSRTGTVASAQDALDAIVQATDAATDAVREYEPPAVAPIPAPTPSPTPNPAGMVIQGKAVALNRDYEVASTSVRVRALTQAGILCASVASAPDGTFSLDVPSTCTRQGQPLVLTVNMHATCISVGFRPGGVATRTLLGRPTGFCGMVVTGRAGYLAGIPNPSSPKRFTGVFVGAWRFGFASAGGGVGCSQTLAAADGAFILRIPEACLQRQESVYLTAGGLPTCVTLPYGRATIRRDVTLFGRRSCN